MNEQGPEKQSGGQSLGGLPEGGSAVVDSFLVPTLVLQETGIVIVNLGI